MESYAYPQPFHLHLKDYFRQHKSAGSRDRREIKEYCYQLLRTGKSLVHLPFEERFEKLRISNYELLGDGIQRTTNNEQRTTDFPNLTTDNAKLTTIFPAQSHLSPKFQNSDFYLSQLNQPLMWVSVNMENLNIVEKELDANNIEVVVREGNAFGLENNPDLSKLTSYKEGYLRIQDITSQQACAYFRAKKNELWWDACAGSGGKSLGLFEHTPTVKIYTTDIRPAILDQLNARLYFYHKKPAKSFVLNLLTELPPEWMPMFDGIIADVPCTGSGTWARNPEHLLYFNEAFIADYVEKQKKITSALVSFLKVGKPLVYITCSVFKDENEDVIEYLTSNFPLKVEEQKYLEGYKNRGENMFVCRLIKQDN